MFEKEFVRQIKAEHDKEINEITESIDSLRRKNYQASLSIDKEKWNNLDMVTHIWMIDEHLQYLLEKYKQEEI